MQHALEVSYPEHKGVSKRMPYEFVAIIAATTTAFIFGLIAMLSWQQSLMVVLAAAALAGGAVFTVQEMHGLGRKRRPAAADLPEGLTGRRP